VQSSASSLSHRYSRVYRGSGVPQVGLVPPRRKGIISRVIVLALSSTVTVYNEKYVIGRLLDAGCGFRSLPATRPVSDPVSGYFMIRRKTVEGMLMWPWGSKMSPVELLRYARLLVRLRRAGAQ
jgi:hypothetical protein